MATKQQKADYYLLSLWAGSTVNSVAEGYEAIRQRREFRLTDGSLLPKGKVRAMVHLALGRQGVNPHHSPSLIHAWAMYHRQMLKAGDIA